MRITRIVLLSLLGLSAAGCEEKPKPASKPGGSAVSAAAVSAPVATSAVASAAAPATRIITEEIGYSTGGTKMKGYLAYPAKGKALPGVLVVHEWWGHNAYARKRAEMLAEAGYAAFAVDMYGDGKKADHPDDAKKFSAEVFGNLPGAKERFQAAMTLLADHASTDPQKIAAIGYCFGGGVVLHMARTGMDLDLVASFHGSLAAKSPAKKGTIKGKVLIAHGADDPMVPPEQVEAFKKEMAAAGVDLRFHAYDGAKHAFTNPSATELGKRFKLPIAYDEKADKASWKELLALLAEVYPAS